jgi:hypothetical protein
MEETMGRLANRITATCKVTRGLVLGMAIACAAGLGAVESQGQTPETGLPPKPSAPAKFSGCVQKAPGSSSTLVISSGTVCATLKGSLAADKLVGHQIELEGVLTPRTAAAGASIQVNSVASVGQSCSDVCSLQPPRSRGLHAPVNGAVPGSEGGTPGVVAPPQ